MFQFNTELGLYLLLVYIHSFLSFQLSYVLLHFDYLICPIEYDEETNRMSLECEKNPVFILAEYDFPETMQALFALVSEILLIAKVFSKTGASCSKLC